MEMKCVATKVSFSIISNPASYLIWFDRILVWVLDYAELGSIRNIIGRLAKHSLVHSKITLIMAYEIMYLSNQHG